MVLQLSRYPELVQSFHWASSDNKSVFRDFSEEKPERHPTTSQVRARAMLLYLYYSEETKMYEVQVWSNGIIHRLIKINKLLQKLQCGTYRHIQYGQHCELISLVSLFKGKKASTSYLISLRSPQHTQHSRNLGCLKLGAFLQYTSFKHPGCVTDMKFLLTGLLRITLYFCVYL